MNSSSFILIAAAFCLELFLPISASAQPRDVTPPVISDIDKLTDSPILGFRWELRAIIKDDRQVQSARIFYRAGGSSAFDSTSMSLEDTVRNVYAGIVPVEKVTIRGLEAYLRVSDGSNITTFPPDNPKDHPAAIEVVVLTPIVKPTLQPAGKYRMVSVPFNLLDPRLSNYFQNYDKTVERLFALRNGRYIEYDTNGFPPNIVPGQAFFLIYREITGILLLPTGLTVVTVEPFELVMAPGWNMIGEPWNFRVSWAMAEKPEGVWSGLYGFDDGGFKRVDILEPWEGYLAYNFNADSATVKLLPREAPPSSQVSKQQVLSNDEWRLALQAQVGAQLDTVNYLGMRHGAGDDWDRFDAPEPPPIGDYVSLYFSHPEWKYAGNYSADYRPLSDRGAFWDFALRSNLEGRKAELRWSGIEAIPQSFEVILLDRRIGQAMDMRQETKYTCFADEAKDDAETATPRFRLIVGNQNFAQEHAEGLMGIPTTFALRQNFPNPFAAPHGQTVIRYALPEAVHVRLSIFDMLGREVKTLVNKNLQAGYHGAVWDGRDEQGRRLATGLYFYRLHAGNFVRVNKMLLVW